MEKIKLVLQDVLLCEIGEPKITTFSNDNFWTSVNITTYFEPIKRPVFLIELSEVASVDFITNIAYYGPNSDVKMGGISVKLKDGYVFEEFVEGVKKALKADDENSLVG